MQSIYSIGDTSVPRTISDAVENRLVSCTYISYQLGSRSVLLVTDRVFAAQICGQYAERQTINLRKKKRGSVNYSTGLDNEVSKTFIISMG